MPPRFDKVGARDEWVAVVLAGGASSRMGADKAFLTWEGAPLLQRQISTLRAAGAATVWISGRPGVDYAAFGCPVLLDAVPGAGALSGLVTALRTTQGLQAWLLVLAVDLPGMTSDYLASLAAAARGMQKGVLPQRGTYFEPLAAVYPVAPTLELAEAHLAAGRFALQELSAALVAQGLAVAHAISPAEQPFFANWNDPTGPRV